MVFANLVGKCEILRLKHFMKVMKMTKAKQEVATGPRVLPVVHYGSKWYFADLRLGQFREIKNPHNYIDFDCKQGLTMCRQAGIVRCSECRMSVVVPTAFEDEKLRCMRCFSSIE